MVAVGGYHRSKHKESATLFKLVANVLLQQLTLIPTLLTLLRNPNPKSSFLVHKQGAVRNQKYSRRHVLFKDVRYFLCFKRR